MEDLEYIKRLEKLNDLDFCNELAAKGFRSSAIKDYFCDRCRSLGFALHIDDWVSDFPKDLSDLSDKEVDELVAKLQKGPPFPKLVTADGVILSWYLPE